MSFFSIVSHSPAVSPAALQHALASSFPFTNGVAEVSRSLSRAASRTSIPSRQATPIHSPGAVIQQHAHQEHLMPRQFNLKTPTHLRPSIGARAHTSGDVPNLGKPSLNKDVPQTLPGAPASDRPKRRRLSFIDLPRRDFNLEAADPPLATKLEKLNIADFAGQRGRLRRRSSVKDRVPTPYPRDDNPFFKLEDTPEEPNNMSRGSTVGSTSGAKA